MEPARAARSAAAAWLIVLAWLGVLLRSRLQETCEHLRTLRCCLCLALITLCTCEPCSSSSSSSSSSCDGA
ncbi:hypothetical protein COO60DRAFT_575670 [Scenedesmus sp. NREL 46B-D3]|nr:hypothetical protein COO60DRAFT_575670 [Scenedesmus sp. NREL 46B-D3]